MDHTPQQRDIIRRLGEVSREIDKTVEQHQAAQSTAFRTLAELGAAMMEAIDYSAQITALGKRHGDLWREFLDTL